MQRLSDIRSHYTSLQKQEKTSTIATPVQPSLGTNPAKVFVCYHVTYTYSEMLHPHATKTDAPYEYFIAIFEHIHRRPLFYEANMEEKEPVFQSTTADTVYSHTTFLLAFTLLSFAKNRIEKLKKSGFRYFQNNKK